MFRLTSAGPPGSPAASGNTARERQHAELRDVELADRDLDGVAAALNDPARSRRRRCRWRAHGRDRLEDDNLRLSERRAEAVVTFLAGRGVVRDRLRAVWYGEQRLLPAFAPGDDRQRRVEIWGRRRRMRRSRSARAASG